MILVFAEAGGERLLGKARELADSIGTIVLAVCSGEKEEKPQKLICFGADEVIRFNATSVLDWSRACTHLVRNRRDLRLFLFPANSFGNAIMGSTYANVFEQISTVTDQVEAFDLDGARRIFQTSRTMLKTAPVGDKPSLWSIKLSSVSEPFEDSSRIGKIESIDLPTESGNLHSPEIGESIIADLSSGLTLLAGKAYLVKSGDSEKKKLVNLARKYSGTFLETSGGIETIYGPCLAIDVRSTLENLPIFSSDVFALNTEKEAPISEIAKLSAVTPDLEKVIDDLIKNLL
jgi:electron transfer flavoprotein alpha subunit